jgi:hypothetical protein
MIIVDIAAPRPAAKGVEETHGPKNQENRKKTKNS